jgi:predicted Rossmann fold nucleotide-binding protein DprA/Smf involved in DNA uptake
MALPPEPPPDLSVAERQVFDQLRSGPRVMDALLSQLQAPTAEVLAAVSGLELRGLVTQTLGTIELHSGQRVVPL